MFLKQTLATQTLEQNEMYHYLNGKLDQHVELVARLETELAEGTQARDSARLQVETELASVQTQFQAELAHAHAETEQLRLELTSLHAFSEQKDALEARTEALEAALARATTQFAAEKRGLELASLAEKNRAKSEMLVRLQETKAALLARTDEQLTTATKRTMMENGHCMEELAFQSKETEKLLSRYERLEDEARGLRVKTKVLEANEAAMAKKNFYYQKVLQKLQHKSDTAALDALVEDELASARQARALEPSAPGALESETATSFRATVAELEASLQHANDWLRALQQEKQFIVAQQDEIIQFLCRAVQDATASLGSSGLVPSGSDAARLAKETMTMDGLVALVPVSNGDKSALDELSSDATRFVLRFLLEKMKLYQQRLALLFPTSRHPAARQRDLLAKQLGVELPPILTSVPPPPTSGLSGASPLKQSRRMFAHAAASVTAAMHSDEPMQYSDWPGPSRKPLSPSPSLLAVATNQFNFVVTGPGTKSPLPSHTSPNSLKNVHFTTVGLPTKGVGGSNRRTHHPPGTASVGLKPPPPTTAPTLLAATHEMLTAWSTTSLLTLATGSRDDVVVQDAGVRL